MKSHFIALLTLLAAGLLEAAPEGVNLLKEPLTITNPQTTVWKNGVYTVTNPDEKTDSSMTQTVTLNQEKPLELTFSAESLAEDYKGVFTGNYGVRLDLTYADGTKQYWVNTGCSIKEGKWEKAQRVYLPEKPRAF